LTGRQWATSASTRLAGTVSEMRVDVGPGYRVCYFQHGQTLVVLLCGGDKRTQDADISRAVAYKTDFLRKI
jgi:putative addiction module killer protein